MLVRMEIINSIQVDPYKYVKFLKIPMKNLINYWLFVCQFIIYVEIKI